MILLYGAVVPFLLLLKLLLLLRKLVLRLLWLVYQLEHFKWHLYHELDLEFESFDVANHLCNLFEDLLPLRFVTVRCRAARLWLCGLEKTFNGLGAAHLDHVSLKIFEPVDLADDFWNRLAVLMARLSQVKQQRYAKRCSLLNFDNARRDAELNNWLNPYAARINGLWLKSL